MCTLINKPKHNNNDGEKNYVREGREQRLADASMEERGANIGAKIKFRQSLVERWWFNIDAVCHRVFGGLSIPTLESVTLGSSICEGHKERDAEGT